ncbi:MAG: LysM peptidoglycan-binding domain-containing protein [Ardenticatenaceae bacterium]|nr:LysM peptidoglycan-binding domain-containing protein [Ardenticatenaceae bacterium]MCB9444294.1 LysM peptidoglycan-binding domain-containing protein [Ardenticatenaceae bacterium]
MKNKPFKRRFLLLFVVVLLILSACERPVPREDTPEAVTPAPTTEVIVIPTAPPEANEAYPATGDGQTGEATTDQTAPEETTDTAVTPEETTTEEAADQTVVDAGGEVTHVVQAGETLGSIAQFYHVSIQDIAAANNIVNIDVLEVGQSLIIKAGAAAEAPAPDTTTPAEGAEQVYVVQAGDNLFRIGLKYGFTAEELAAYNNIPDITRIDVGQVIKIPPQ